MRAPIVLLTFALASTAQIQPAGQNGRKRITIEEGVPLRVAIGDRVRIRTTGQPIRGQLIAPVYVHDTLALPAGTVVEGHVAEIGGVPARRRFEALLSGNFTPTSDVRAEFDVAVLSDGSRASLRTAPSRGTAHSARVSLPPETPQARGRQTTDARHAPEGAEQPAVLAFKTPGKMTQLRSRLFSMFPYHRQAWQPGTLFTSVLREPVIVPAADESRVRPENPIAEDAGDAEVSARLVTEIDSEQARQGTRVEAIVTRPVFSAKHELLVPEGSRLVGSVVEVKRARLLHRNGKVLFVFRQLVLPGGAAQDIQGYVEKMETDFDSHLALDSEGAARISDSKTRFIFPAIAATVAGLSLHQDYNQQGIPDQDVAGRAESGAVGLGLVGTVLAQTSRPLASSIAFVGAGFSVYSTFFARGADVMLPVNTPVTISLRQRGGQGVSISGRPRDAR